MKPRTQPYVHKIESIATGVSTELQALLSAVPLPSVTAPKQRESVKFESASAQPIPAMIYLITFACYGCRLHGDTAGSVDRAHNLPGSPLLEARPARVAAELRKMDQPPYDMDCNRRAVVLAALLERCQQQGWKLLAAHVRTNHTHMVVEAEDRPERVMNDVKSYASRLLNRMGLDGTGRKRWARHGSTRWLWKPEHVSAAIHYVVEEQGERMAVFEASG